MPWEAYVASALGQLGVHDGDEDALLLGVRDQRIERAVTGVAHDGDAIGLGRDRLLELGHHLQRVPVRPDVRDVRAEGILCCLRPVVDDGLEAAAFGTAREEDDLHSLAELARARAAPTGGGARASLAATAAASTKRERHGR